MSDSIKVAIKVRPLIKREKVENLPIQWSVQGNTIISTDTELKKRGDGGFCFDHIFDMDATNSEVFDSIVRPIVDAAVNGFNGTVFAYGQTSSGKTYTMMGTSDEPGIVPLAINHMFDAITNTAGREFLLRVSYLEIYKEKVNDLLDKTCTDLKLKEDSSGQVFLQCKEEITNCPENMLSIMKKGDKNRRTGETNMNERSSRSHTIFRITIESREVGGDSDGAVQVSQLNLVDLAGSERARQTGATGERFKEGLHINLSLSTLGLVIMQLSECQDGQKYVNFRDSKLTRLLQNSLGGNAMTTIICAVTPAAVDETQCTLSFACRAKSVKNKPQVNEVMSDATLLKRYAKQISKLQTELEIMKQENRMAEVEEMESRLQEKERLNQLLEERIELLKTRIVSGDTISDDSFKIKAKRRQTWGGPGMVNHLPGFQPKPCLTTATEVSREKSCRKSIIQSVDLMNQTFQTAFTDFELELFKSECDRVNGSDSEDEPFITKRKHRVTFKDEVVENTEKITPEKLNRNTATQTISCQASPSTPKHVLRQCINNLTKEFDEMREFTTLEKQLLRQDNNVKKLEEAESEKPALEYAPEVKKRLGSLKLAEETNAGRVIAELCSKLGELEKQNILEKETSRKATKQFSELERQMRNITSERDEFEYMSGELRSQLKKKTAELELKNMSEESVKEVELKKIFELERKLKNVTLENGELRAESSKKINELQKEAENVVSERKEFELIRRELCVQLNMKTLELNNLKNDPESANAEMMEQLRQLEKRNEETASEKAALEQTIVDLRAELSQVSSEAESRILSERTAHEKTLGEVSQLQKQVEDLASKGNELERVNVDLNVQLEQSVLNFESKIAAEQIARQEAVKRNTELEEQLESLIVKNQQLEANNADLSKTVSEFEAAVKSEIVAQQETVEKLSALQKEIGCVTLQENEVDETMKSQTSELESRIALHQNTVEKAAELEKRVADVATKIELEEMTSLLCNNRITILNRNTELKKVVESVTTRQHELERANAELQAELKSKASEYQNAKEKAANLEIRVADLVAAKTEMEEIVRTQENEHQSALKRISELEQQIKRTETERNELEQMNAKLQAELSHKMSELEWRGTLEQTEYQNAKDKAANLEIRVSDLVSAKTEMEEILSKQQNEHQNSLKRISDLEQQIECAKTEKSELEQMNAKLQAELSLKMSELESMATLEQTDYQNAKEKAMNLEIRVADLVSAKTEMEEIVSKQQNEHQNALKRISDLEQQIECAKTEKSELEQVNAKLQAELSLKMSELESRGTLEQTEYQNAKDKAANLEIRVADLVSAKTEMEELVSKQQNEHQNALKRISELEQQIECVKTERNQFEQMNVKLQTELSHKMSELESRGTLEQSEYPNAEEKTQENEHQNALKKISDLERQIECAKTEKSELEQMNAKLQAELSLKMSELESRGTLEQTQYLNAKEKTQENEHQNALKKISDLERQIECAKTERNEFEQMNGKLQAELSHKMSELESRGTLEQTEYLNAKVKTQENEQQNALKRISELERQIECAKTERNEFEQMNVKLRAELSHKTSELESRGTLEPSEYQNAKEKAANLEVRVADLVSAKTEMEEIVSKQQHEHQNALKRISDLEQQIEYAKTERNEFEQMNAKLQAELSHKMSELESRGTLEQTEYQNAKEKTQENEHQNSLKRISELEQQIQCAKTERNELEQMNAKLQAELSDKMSELESRNLKQTNLNAELEGMELEQLLRTQETDRQEVVNRISDPEKQTECTEDERNRVNVEQRAEIHKSSELELRTLSQCREDRLDNQSYLSYSKQLNDSTFDTSALMLNSQLEESLHLKSQELDEIKCDVQSLKQDVENLQKTIYLLTTENMEMTGKLTAERENGKQVEANLQKTIDDLYCRISDVTSQKITLESNLAALNDQIESMRSRGALSEAVDNEEEPFASYKHKIDKLTAENIELSTSIAEKNKELESIKESKSLLFDHECMYKEKAVALAERNESLRAENDELSTDLIDKIEENDELKEQCETLKKKIEESLPKDEASSEGNSNNLQSQNSMLKAEVIDLKTKLTTLSEENTKFSNDLLQTIEDLDSSRNEKSNLQVEDHQTPTLADKVATLQEKVNQLTQLNQKLSDLKLASCNQCVHLKNLNESRRAMKLEAKTLNQKLEDLQRKFDRKCEDTEILKNKINQESNRELSPRVSFVDEMNVSFVEERVRTLNDELQTLKADHDKLTVLYEDKCNELVQLRSDANAESSRLDSTPRKRPEKNGGRLVQIQSHIDQLKTDIDEIRLNSMNFAATLDQFRAEKASLLKEIDGLRASNEELGQTLSTNENITAEKVRVLENELTNMSKELERLSDREKTLESQKLTLQIELEELKIERDNKSGLVESLRNDLDSVTRQKNQLISNSMDNRYKEELETLKRQREELNQQALARIGELQERLTRQEHMCEELQRKGVYVEQLYHQSEEEKRLLTEQLRMVEANWQNNHDARYKCELDSISAQYQQRVVETESNLQKLNDTLNKYVDENLNLKQELAKLKNAEEKQSEIERLNRELEDIKLCMMKELRSLKCTVNSAELSERSVNEIFLTLVQTLVWKEQEMVKMMRETYEKEKQVLEEEMQQCADTEKRATAWAKELETEIEKLQTELTERERSQKDCEHRISRQDHLLEESARENEILIEKMSVLEADLHNLQTEFEKLHKADSKQEEAICVAQKREKEQIIKDKEMEFQSKLKAEAEKHEKRINELTRAVESYKTKNLEMSSLVEGLEANEQQLKNIIEANAIEMKKKNGRQSLERLSKEMQQLTEAYNDATEQLEQRALHIEEISAILKSKCDTLSEYKAKLDAVLPEYELLKDRVVDQKTTIEKYRQEIEALRTEKEEQLYAIKDKLESEEIKNAGLSKQLNNRNVAMAEELNQLKQKYEDLQQENAKLERNVRNGKIKAEAEMEELKEANETLKSSLVGASNRVAELQEVKNRTIAQLVDAKAMYELLLQENTEIKKTLSSYETKYNAASSSTHETKLDELLLEKNTIALELEYKKLQLNKKEKEVIEYSDQVQQLQEKNKELDEELDEYATIIRQRDVEISELEGKLDSRLTENTRINELQHKLERLNEENEKLRDQVDALNMRLQMEDDGKSQQNVIRKRENFDAKLNSSRKLREARQCGSDDVLSMMSQDQSWDSSKKMPNNFEGAWNRLTELESEKYEITKALADSRRQCDSLSEENRELKKVLQLYRSQLNLEDDENKIARELENPTELNQKENKLKECANKIRDLATKNKDLDIELGKSAAIIHERDVEISKLRERLKVLKEENNKVKSEIGEIQARSRTNKSFHNDVGEYNYRSWNNTSVSNESTRRQLLNSVVEDDDKLRQLKKKLHDLELQLVSKNGKLATLELQIQSQSFPYQRRCKELEEKLLALRNKNTELNMEVKKLQRTVNDVNAWECDVCRRWRVNRKDQGCQTIPSSTVRFCSSSSGVVEDHIKIEKLEKEKTLMKALCRTRNRHIKELETEIERLKELIKT